MRNGTAIRRERITFGDFQTPRGLAEQVCSLLRGAGVSPQSIVEPTCGVGSFLLAAADAFPSAKQLLGVEINPEHLAVTTSAVSTRSDADRFQLEQADFFHTNWPDLLRDLAEPLLVIGNPPWVTNATQGSLASDNLPRKSNLHGHRGIDAITGKANFDISEWMLLQMFDWLRGRSAVLAMLCKSAVARRVLVAEWQKEPGLRSATINMIDAESAFGAAVNACLLVATFSPGARCDSAIVFPTAETLQANGWSTHIGWRDGRLIANLDQYIRGRHLCTTETAASNVPASDNSVWRSGVKHDCTAVMELMERDGELWNGLGEKVVVEPECLYPLLKSGDLAAGRTRKPQKWLVLPQRFVGDDTSRLEKAAPQTWRYLMNHATRLDKRRSSIYRRQPRFAIFGIGNYTFTKWKVAVSGMAKQLRFTAVGSYRSRPIVFDDTSYFLPCRSRQEAVSRAELLNSRIVQDFFSAFVFWDAKRPITAELLRSLDLARLESDPHLAKCIRHAADNARESGMG